MPDFTGSTAFRNLLAAAASGFFYWATLHDATGGFVASDVYADGFRGELPTLNGYIRGAKTVTLTNTDGVLDGPNAVWLAETASIGPVSYTAFWGAATNNIIGAGLISVKDDSLTPQTATVGNTMTYTIVDPLTIPTPI